MVRIGANRTGQFENLTAEPRRRNRALTSLLPIRHTLYWIKIVRQPFFHWMPQFVGATNTEMISSCRPGGGACFSRSSRRACALRTQNDYTGLYLIHRVSSVTPEPYISFLIISRHGSGPKTTCQTPETQQKPRPSRPYHVRWAKWSGSKYIATNGFFKQCVVS
jgi:hypothetical protein